MAPRRFTATFNSAPNSLFTSTNTQSDFFVSPFVKLSVLGNLSPTVSYSAYVSGGPDVFSRIQIAMMRQLLWAAASRRRSETSVLGAIYEHSLVYDGIFRSLLFQVNDVSGFMGYQYSAGGGLVVQPSFMTTYRFADLVSQDRFLFTLKADVGAIADEGPQSSADSQIEVLRFYERTGAGRRETLPSISGGLTTILLAT